MTPAAAKRQVVIAVAVTGTLVVVRDLAKGNVTKLRVPIGLAVAGVVLAAGAESAPQIAGPMAILVLVSAVFLVGGEAFAAIAKTVER